MHIGLQEIGLIVGAFIAGYGVAHIPGGMLAQAKGMKFTLLCGILLEAIGAAWSARAHDLHVLLLARFICGIGGSIYISCAIGLTTAWFREKELVTAIGLVTGVAFTIGAAAGLFGWEILVVSLGWRAALLWGSAVSVATFVAMLFLCPEPKTSAAEEVRGGHLDLASLRRVFGSLELWLLSFSFIGAYGAYFTAAQLMPEFAERQLAMSHSAAHGLGVVLLFAGIPGSFVGGWLSDRLVNIIPVFVGACAAEAIALVLIPSLGSAGLAVAAAVIGGTTMFCFVMWISMPGLFRDRLRISDVPTAAGLLLTIVGIGGFAIPPLYGLIATRFGYVTGWIVIGALCLGASLISLAAQRRGRALDPRRA